MMLSDVCLVYLMSVVYIGPKSRTERPGETKIGTEVANVTRDSDTTFRFTHHGVNASGSCSGERGTYWPWELNCYVAVCRLGGAKRFGAHRGRRGVGAYCGGRPPTACFVWRLLVAVMSCK